MVPKKLTFYYYYY